MTKHTTLHTIMVEAVHQCIQHVDSGGLPFVGVVVQSRVAVSNFGFNRVYETGDASAHAEVVAMRDAMSRLKCSDLSGTVLLATGEPCGCVTVSRKTAGLMPYTLRQTVKRLPAGGSITTPVTLFSASPMICEHSFTVLCRFRIGMNLLRGI